MVSDPIQQCCRHLAVPEYLWPFPEGQVRGDNKRCALIELGDQVEQELTAALREWEEAQFIQHYEIELRQALWQRQCRGRGRACR